MKNYRITNDLYYPYIEETEEFENGYDVFSTLDEAKRELIYEIENDIIRYKEALKRIKSITPDNLYGTY